MRKYELVALLMPTLSLEDLEKVTKKLSSFIETASGKSVTSNVMGKKPLAYPIKKQLEANYVLFNFEMAPGDGAKEVDTKFKQDENVIRHLLVRSDK